MMTPAACVEAWRVMPCNSMAVSMTRWQFGVAFIKRQQLRIAVDILADSLLARLLRNHGCGAVDQVQIDIERSPDIANCGFGAHGAECG